MYLVTVIGMFMRTSWGAAVAQKVYAAACWVATAAQNALNISYATFLALTGVGIAVIIGAAAAMWYFSSQMNAATESVKEYNAAVSEMPARTRTIVRAGEEELYRRGVEP
jgi:cytochrome b561